MDRFPHFKKNFNIGYFSDTIKAISFKFCMLIILLEIYIAIVGLVTLILVQGHWFVGQSSRLMIERLRVQIPAGAVGEFSSPELPLCADSYLVSVPPTCYRSGT